MTKEKTTREKYVLYDSIVSTIMTNVLVERERCGKFLLYDFTPKDDSEKLYFNIAAIAADLKRENIYLDMPFWDYVKFKFKRRKRRKNLKWFSPSQKKDLGNEFKTSVIILMSFISEKMGVPVELFKEINDAYYGWVD
mgnify:CR=1 FL=1